MSVQTHQDWTWQPCSSPQQQQHVGASLTPLPHPSHSGRHRWCCCPTPPLAPLPLHSCMTGMASRSAARPCWPPAGQPGGHAELVHQASAAAQAGPPTQPAHMWRNLLDGMTLYLGFLHKHQGLTQPMLEEYYPWPSSWAGAVARSTSAVRCATAQTAAQLAHDTQHCACLPCTACSRAATGLPAPALQATAEQQSHRRRVGIARKVVDYLSAHADTWRDFDGTGMPPCSVGHFALGCQACHLGLRNACCRDRGAHSNPPISGRLQPVWGIEVLSDEKGCLCQWQLGHCAHSHWILCATCSGVAVACLWSSSGRLHMRQGRATQAMQAVHAARVRGSAQTG